MKSATLTVILLLFSSAIAFARTISLPDAKAKAMNLRHAKEQSTAPSTRAISATIDEAPVLVLCREASEHTLYYIFNYPDGGFAIIGGDETAREILGYCPQGSFDAENMPEGFEDMLHAYEEQIVLAIEQGPMPQKAKQRTEEERQDIAPLIKTQWSQGAPYNRTIPRIDLDGKERRFATGCNATAAAQLMYFYQYPQHGHGTNAYQLSYDNGSEITFEADFGSIIYEWDKMRASYPSQSYTAEEANAVANLMYHLGVAMNTDYNINKVESIIDGETKVEYQTDSSSPVKAAHDALIKNFGYDSDAIFERRTNYSDEAWENLIYNELKTGHPILYTGQSAQGGHAFLCHGYDSETDCYCINWGWGGKYDGYFPLTGTQALKAFASDPTNANQNLSFSQRQTASIGLIPLTMALDYDGNGKISVSDIPAMIRGNKTDKIEKIVDFLFQQD